MRSVSFDELDTMPARLRWTNEGHIRVNMQRRVGIDEMAACAETHREGPSETWVQCAITTLTNNIVVNNTVASQPQRVDCTLIFPTSGKARLAMSYG